MIDPRSWSAQSSGMMTQFTEAELEQRLGLYRVFLKLYEHHRDLLNEILELENSGKSYPYKIALQYIQGVVSNQQVHLVTNLIQGKSQVLLQSQHTWLIGRDRQSAISIRDERLSRQHAAIQYVAGQGFYLIDLNSTNGSFINSERVWRCALLKEGDRIRLGSLTFTFFMTHTSHTVGAVPPSVLERIRTCFAYTGPEAAQVTAVEPEAAVAPEPVDLPLPPELRETSGFLQSHLNNDELTKINPESARNAPQSVSLLEQWLSAEQTLGDCN